MESVKVRVARGAEWLDKEVPGWEEQIDLSTLDLADSCQCILGQVYRNVAKACCWDGYIHGKNHLCLNTFELGFTTFGSDYDWALLDQAWITLIKDRFDRGDLNGHRG
jgi:hypothetical protein